jgi:putative exosortase-associated protein (TIGR04073 family)
MTAMLSLLCLLSAPSAWAQTPDPSSQTPPLTELEKRLTMTELEKRYTKLGRGVANVAFGWLEIPVTMYERLEDGHAGADILVVGPIVGAVRAIMRTGVGVVEVLTFSVSTKDDDFRPWLYPEYVF